jgi:uncharacterized protein YbjT (DUF2867 family)
MATNPESTQGKTGTIIGATGLIGSHVLALLQKDPNFKTVRVLSRRAVSFDHPKMQALVIDFADKAAFKTAIAGSDAVFCAVGTTQKKVKGDKVAYRRVDYDIPVHAAQFCAETGCPHFLLVSSVGANSHGNSFYLKLKGEVEDRIRTMNIQTISVFRPSMLLGKREEHRFGEGIVQALTRMLSFLIPSRYKPIEAGDVARAMVAASRKETPGVHIYHYAEMMSL